MSSTSNSRAMASWFLDKNHVIIPVIKHRLCLDYFIHNVAWLFSLFSLLWSGIIVLLAANASPYLFYITLLNLIMIPWLWYGEWAMGDRLAGQTYLYLVGLWWYIIALLWVGSAAYVHIRQSQEFIEETWYQMSAELLIPFTTELDQKNLIEDNVTSLFALSITTALIHLHSLGEAWRALGGMMRLVQLKYATLLPEFVPLFLLCAGSAAYAVYAASIATFAMDSTTTVILWHAAMSLLGVLAVCGVFIARARWGITFISHAIAVVSFAPISFILFITSLVLNSRAKHVDSWVEPRWEDIKYLVPSQYAALSWEKYALASQTPMLEASMTGLFASVLLFISVIFQARCAAVLLSVGSELYVSRSRLDAVQAEITTKLASAKAPIPLSADDINHTSVTNGRPNDLPIMEWGENQSRTAVLINNDNDPLRRNNDRNSSYNSRFTFSKSSDPGTPLRAATGGYGTLDDAPSSPNNRNAYPPTGNMTSMSVDNDYPVKAPSAPPYQRVPYSDTNNFSSIGSENIPIVSGTTKDFSISTAIGSRVSAIHQYRFLLTMYEKQLEELNKRVTWPSTGTFFRGLSFGLGQAWNTHKLCFILTGIIVFIFVCAIGGALAPIGIAGQCGVLIREPAKRTFSTTFQIEQGITRTLFGDIYIENTYPYGGIDVAFEHVPMFPEIRTDNATIELIALAAEEGDLPTAAELQAMVNLTDFVGFLSDDDVGGYLSVSIRLNPPSNAQAKCLGMRIRLIGSSGLVYLRVNSNNGMVNITGNINDLAINLVNYYAFQGLNVRTDTGPIIVNNGYIDRLGLDPVAGFDASTKLVSNSGDIWLNVVSTSGLQAYTSGNIHTSTLGSFSAFNCGGAVCGDIFLTTTGYGKVVMNQAFAGYNAYIQTEHGDVLGVNTGQIMGKITSIKSIDGAVILSNFLQTSGNETFVTTAGKIAISVVFANRMHVTALGDTDVSVVELFLGCTNPGAAINPPIDTATNYSDPGAWITTESGDITILGIGGNPLATSFANIASLFLTSDSGKIKVEVNGGGINAPYNVQSDKGEVVVEIDGRPVSNVGILGDQSARTNNNTIYIFSDKGNVQMSLLPSPL